MPPIPDIPDDTRPPARAKRAGRAGGEGRQEPPRLALSDPPRPFKAGMAQKEGKRGKKSTTAPTPRIRDNAKPRKREAEGNRPAKKKSSTAGRTAATATVGAAGTAIAAARAHPTHCTTATGGSTDPPVMGFYVPTGAVWHGITWQDMSGRDVDTQKLRFTLLKRGMLSGYKSCARLHGAALKQRLREICESHRIDHITGRKKKDPQREPPCAKLTARRRRKPP